MDQNSSLDDYGYCVDCVYRKIRIEHYNQKIQNMLNEEADRELLYFQKLDHHNKTVNLFLSILATERTTESLLQFIDGHIDLDIHDGWMRKSISTSINAYDKSFDNHRLELVQHLVRLLTLDMDMDSNTLRDDTEETFDNIITKLLEECSKFNRLPRLEFNRPVAPRGPCYANYDPNMPPPLMNNYYQPIRPSNASRPSMSVAPSFSAAPTSFSVAPASFSVEPASFSVAPASFTVAPASFTVAPASFTAAPPSFTVAPASFSAAAAAFSVAPSGFSVAPASFSAAAISFSAATTSFSTATTSFSAAPTSFSTVANSVSVAPPCFAASAQQPSEHYSSGSTYYYPEPL